MNPLELLAERSAGGFPNLTEARLETERRLEEACGRFSGLECDQRASVVLFGSWGRRELTSQSDDDWAVLVARGTAAVGPPLREVSDLVGKGGRGPESVAVLNEPVHHGCKRRVLGGYLDDSVKDFRPPRFLLNDVIRYWRTICVDFVGKERRGTGEKWALRNLDAVDAGVRAIGAYDAFIGLLGNPELRGELERLSRDEALESDVFKQGKRLVKDFQQGLLALLFETSLEPLVREYGIF